MNVSTPSLENPSDLQALSSTLRYESLTAVLKHWAERYPEVLELRELGRSREGRVVWLAVVGDRGPEPERSVGGRPPTANRPAFYVDANIHSLELNGSTAALALIHRLCEDARTEAGRALLRRITFYVVPRVSPDGAEHFLTSGEYVRSTPALYPHEDLPDGLHMKDMDGDGVVALMRIPDPTGGWRVSKQDPRVMARRTVEDLEGPFYQLVPEGMLHNFDGHVLRVAPHRHGLDYNRNFPHAWKPEREQKGAGDFPLSEPEPRAIAEFINRHTNIAFFLALHTGIEVIIPPEGARAYSEFSLADRALFKQLADPGVRILKMPFESLFTVDYGKVHGDFGTWLYEHLGIPGFVVELWAPSARVGYTLKDDIQSSQGLVDGEPIDLKVAAYVDENGWTQELRPWAPFDHPQLGKVELGGWRHGFHSQAPDGPVLQEIGERLTEYALVLARALPQVVARSVTVEPMGDGAFHLGITLVNGGMLSTGLTQQGQSTGVCKEVLARLVLPEGATRTGGPEKQRLGYLEGYGGMARAEWVVKAPAGTEVRIVVEGGRAGSFEKTAVLGA